MVRPSKPVPFASIDPIRLPDLEVATADDIHAGATLSGRQLTTIDLSGRELSSITIDSCALFDVNAHHAQLRGTSFLETTIERLDAPVFLASRTRWRDVTVERSRLGSAELYDATWESVAVRQAKLGFVNLRGARLTNVIVEGCSIEELDLSAAALNRVTFVDTSIASLVLDKATMRYVDLRGVRLQRISGVESLKGATISSDQVYDLAPLLASHFGITID